MPKRSDIKSILILGSGPIIIGQACEFDYSGTQACKALRQEGYRIILVNSNPATIMTDPGMADATYIEPLDVETVHQIIIKEKPDALLPTVGGQTALNLAMELFEKGYLDQHNVELIGANVGAIRKAESRSEFKAAMQKIGIAVPSSALCTNMDQARSFKQQMDLPLIVRPSFTLGGLGGGIAFNETEFESICQNGLSLSPTHEILLEQSVLGWKEYELEVMRDRNDNVVIICSIENLDPMGVHTGDSITIAPQQTLNDKLYQKMRDAAIAIIREIGVDTGGSNIQFAINPENGDMIVIEMNPRVSRSSALASKATGYPIAKIAALLSIGYTLDEISNDITRETPASFEPTIDYVVTKLPRFAFEKFPGASDTLDSQMHAVGEAMSIGRTFKESFQKAFRSLEIGRMGLGSDGNLNQLYADYALDLENIDDQRQILIERIQRPTPFRIFFVKDALLQNNKYPGLGLDVEAIYEKTGIDRWFLNQIQDLVDLEADFKTRPAMQLEQLRRMKQNGFSDRQLAFLQTESDIRRLVAGDPERKEPATANRISSVLKKKESEIAQIRKSNGLVPVYKTVDTCAGEFEAYTPYLYSTYEQENESVRGTRKKVLILGGGPNRIGQGIEFDYCCCHASFALQAMDIESIMINSNPETVSTDYDTSDKLYFEPLTLEDVLHICELEQPDGIILSFGGQTPLGLAHGLEAAGWPILGTSPDSIDRAEDRDRFSAMLDKLNLRQPDNGMAHNFEEARQVVSQIGYPCLVRPSYVLGGRAMAIVYDEDNLKKFMKEAESVSPEHPVLIDRFLQDAIELDVDAIADGKDVFIAGIMQHVEEAGIHSGDSACILPPPGLSAALLNEIRIATTNIARELNVVGLLNIQYAIQANTLYIIEVNPRASRTIPFVSKAIGLPLPALATRVLWGESLQATGLLEPIRMSYSAVKEAVMPFNKFPGADIILGPEMKSTGEVMGISQSPAVAYIKAVMGTNEKIPASGGVFFSVSNKAKTALLEQARKLVQDGYQLYATEGTAQWLKNGGLAAEILNKIRDQKSPNAIEAIQDGKVQIVINIPDSQNTRDDSFLIRQEATRRRVLCVTTVAGARALIDGLDEMKKHHLEVNSLQRIHGQK
ncbi:MAG: carbamoyl-phosphate synthase large subunit [Leptospiraceae bacterium]|nr:carbamoyl-phosphate synthase large subunit [Leptospiraceae bacterium]